MGVKTGNKWVYILDFSMKDIPIDDIYKILNLPLKCLKIYMIN